MRAEDRLLYQLARAEHVMRSVLDQRLGARGITLTAWAVLSHVAGTTGLSVSELARRTFVTQQAVSKIAADLERRGLVARTKRTGNRRIRDLSATDQGRALSETCDAEIIALETQLREQLGVAGQRQATVLFDSIYKMFAAVPSTPSERASGGPSTPIA